MKAFKTGLMTYFTATAGGAHNTFYLDMAGRLYDYGSVPPESSREYPYAVFHIIGDIPEYPGGHTIEELILEFSIFSADYSLADDYMTHLRTLYDDCVLTITGYTPIYFIRSNFIDDVGDYIDLVTPSGTTGVKHSTQDYEIQITT